MLLFAQLAVALSLSINLVNAFPSFERSVQSCADIQPPTLPNAEIVSIERKARYNYTVSASPPLLLQDVTGLNFCEVDIILTHPGVDDKVLVQVWLPLNNWNGRFIALGGSGWAAGPGALGLGPVVAQGFAAASTDAGVPGDGYSPESWALRSNGEVNLGLLTNFASRSIHDMAVVGKAVTTMYFGTAPNYSYWNGCSTGGRQGLVAAEKYPDDFDGILAGAPAIYWPEYVMAELWPQVIMNEEKTYPSNCELDAITQAAIDACDNLDGIQDRVITEPSHCHFDPFTMVGSKISCDGELVTITRSVASIVRKIWDGPRTHSGKHLWYGSTIGSPLTWLANTTVSNGIRTAYPFFVPDTWIRYFVQKDPSFDTSRVGSTKFTELFFQSAREYDRLIGSADPDLSGLEKAGGKLLLWHGEADQLIYPQGSVQYHRQVQKTTRNNSRLDDYFRLFLAPGVAHCGQAGLTAGAIPSPSDLFGALISWVENGTAPEVVKAMTDSTTEVQFSRKDCRYPLVAKYRGTGDSSSADNYDCA